MQAEPTYVITGRVDEDNRDALAAVRFRCARCGEPVLLSKKFAGPGVERRQASDRLHSPIISA